MTGFDEDSPQVIVRRRGLTMTVRIFGADSFDTLGAQIKSFQVSLPSIKSQRSHRQNATGLRRPRGRFVRGGRSYSMCVDRGEVAHL